MSPLVPAVCAGLSVALLVGPHAVPSGQAGLRSPTVRAAPVPDDRGLIARWRWLWAGLAAVGAWSFVQGPAAPVAAVLAAAGVLVAAARAEPPGVRRRREDRQRELPSLVELYAAALNAGAAPGPALALVCAALPGPAADDLLQVHARLQLGASAAVVWDDLAAHPELGPLGRTMARAQGSGASVVTAVRALSDDLGERSRSAVEDRARAVGVRAALPLGLCLLPAFLLTGIVPLVAGALGSFVP